MTRLKLTPLPGWGLRLVGKYTATVVPVSLQASNVQQMLPSRVKLLPNPMTGPDHHPVFFFFGHQVDVHYTCPLQCAARMDYLETILMVPYVAPQKLCCGDPDSKGYNYSPALYLDDMLPVVGGRLFYRLTKRVSGISSARGRFDVVSYCEGDPIMSLNYREHGTAGHPSQFPHFRPMEGVFHQTSIEAALINVQGGPFICSTFDWNLDTAVIRPASGTLTVSESFVNGMPTGTFPFQGIGHHPMGAFRLHTHWKYSLPYLCWQ